MFKPPKKHFKLTNPTKAVHLNVKLKLTHRVTRHSIQSGNITVQERLPLLHLLHAFKLSVLLILNTQTRAQTLAKGELLHSYVRFRVLNIRHVNWVESPGKVVGFTLAV